MGTGGHAADLAKAMATGDGECMFRKLGRGELEKKKVNWGARAKQDNGHQRFPRASFTVQLEKRGT